MTVRAYFWRKRGDHILDLFLVHRHLAFAGQLLEDAVHEKRIAVLGLFLLQLREQRIALHRQRGQIGFGLLRDFGDNTPSLDRHWT